MSKITTQIGGGSGGVSHSDKKPRHSNDGKPIISNGGGSGSISGGTHVLIAGYIKKI